MARVAWSRKALRDLDLIYAYLAAFDGQAAARIVNHLIDAGNSLEDFPNRGRAIGRGRRELATVPPYVIRYTVSDGGAQIRSVIHGARRRD